MLSILWKHTCIESAYPLLNNLISEGKPSSPALFKCSTAFKKLEASLLGLVASLVQALQGLLARRVLLAADNAPFLRLHQVLLGEAAAGVLGSAVVDLGLGADGGHLSPAATGTSHHVVTAGAIATGSRGACIRCDSAVHGSRVCSCILHAVVHRGRVCSCILHAVIHGGRVG